MNTLATLAITLIIPTAAVTLGYLGLCAVRPFKRCPRCQATGARKLMLGRSRVCGRCHGERYVIRTGPKLANHLRRFTRELSKGRNR